MTWRNLNSQQVERLLKQDRSNYVHHYITGCTIHNNEGDEIGRFSVQVLRNMLLKGRVIQTALSDEFWSSGYFNLKTA